MSDAQQKPSLQFGHRLVRMTGRDPSERGRTATPLELLFDLAFVVAFGQASGQFAHLIADAHWQLGLLGFVFVVVGTCWAWINFTQFSSAYDTDDWFYRITTMVQMIGVVIYALGIPAFFESLGAGEPIDNTVLVAGYIVMRVALIAQWLRVARHDTPRRRTALGYAMYVGIAQLGWVVLAILHTRAEVFFALGVLLFVVEFFGPQLAERKSSGTPWHPHHIVERYGLLAIITFGEGIFGTVEAVSGLVAEQGWSAEAVLVVVAGVGLTFGLWWTYFILPSALILERFRDRVVPWKYSHLVIYGSIVATGAGLHVAALVIEGKSEVGVLGAIVSVALPVLVFTLAVFSIYTWMVRAIDAFHFSLIAAIVVALSVAVLLAAAGASIGLCLVIVTLAPAILVVGYEVLGYKHEEVVLEKALA